ncbi:DUF1996 domain-containing protein [Saccharothrix deserti]|uniref:DUF1996 domain-containing protein n=1 Tax=Saccharothrix deserti TaxID=2593674 RepID=UPI00131DBC62|nr:DUF1996 domain-containing protein [Saccharothrix deserti]
MKHAVFNTKSRRFRVLVGFVALAVAGTATAAIAANGRQPSNAAPLSAFVPIENVKANVTTPRVGRDGSTGVFTVDCGTNGNRKFSPDNPVAQPGVKNGAQHVHDFVGNQSISADSSDQSLVDSETTCRNGDRSSYFWPVVRIVEQANAVGADAETLKAAGTPTISCPTVANRLPAVPEQARDEVDRNLALLDQQIAEANQRLIDTKGQGGPNFVNNAILGPLRSKRVATLDRIAIAIGRNAPRPAGLESLADCDLSYDGAHTGHGSTGGATTPPATSPNAAPPAVTPTVNCPTVRGKLRGVPAQAVDEVNRNLDLLDKQIAEANQRLVSTQGQGGPNFVNNAILGPLKDKRFATLDRIAIAISRNAPRPAGLEALAPCKLDNANPNPGNGNPNPNPGNGGNQGNPAELPGVQGPNLEIAGNVGGIVQPAAVKIEYRGNPTSKVVAMPKFLKAITGDAKPTSRGPANARATWTCSGFTDRLSDKYVICPAGQKVMRVHDFASCWDGKNTDSANHRDHLAVADRNTGTCPAGTKAVPQLRISISYDIPQDVQRTGRYQLDSFPEENHNPFSDHNDFVNVNSDQTMAKIVDCVNTGRRCK